VNILFSIKYLALYFLSREFSCEFSMEAIKYVVETFNAREWDEVRNSENVRESVSPDVFKLRNFTMEQLTQRLIIQESHGKKF
jgi:hypothetical protein